MTIERYKMCFGRKSNEEMISPPIYKAKNKEEATMTEVAHTHDTTLITPSLPSLKYATDMYPSIDILMK